jgi:hypothetical protein
MGTMQTKDLHIAAAPQWIQVLSSKCWKKMTTKEKKRRGM